MKRVIQVAPSNRLQRAQTVADLVVELKEQHVKLNEALRQLSLYTESDVSGSGSGITSGSGSSSTDSSADTAAAAETSGFMKHFLMLGA